MSVAVPVGGGPGRHMSVTAPNNKPLIVRMPPGSRAGSQFKAHCVTGEPADEGIDTGINLQEEFRAEQADWFAQMNAKTKDKQVVKMMEIVQARLALLNPHRQLDQAAGEMYMPEALKEGDKAEARHGKGPKYFPCTITKVHEFDPKEAQVQIITNSQIIIIIITPWY